MSVMAGFSLAGKTALVTGASRGIADTLNGVNWVERDPATSGGDLVARMLAPDSIVGFVALGAAAEDGDAAAVALLRRLPTGHSGPGGAA